MLRVIYAVQLLSYICLQTLCLVALSCVCVCVCFVLVWFWGGVCSGLCFWGRWGEEKGLTRDTIDSSTFLKLFDKSRSGMPL